MFSPPLRALHRLLLPYPKDIHAHFRFSLRHRIRVSTVSTQSPPRKPTNEQIPYTSVRVVDPQTERLSPARQPLQTLLSSLDLKKWTVELVAEMPEPIVRISDRKEAYQRYKEQRKALKKGLKAGVAPKEIQLTWSTASGDVSHKLAQARLHLEKGHKVDVVFGPKKRQRLPPVKEMQARAHHVLSELQDVAKEWKEREMTGAIMIMFFQGKSESQ